MSSRIQEEQGVALILCLLAMVLMSTLGSGLIVATTSEMLIAGNYKGAIEARTTASAMLDRALADLAGTPDWTQVLNGTVHSTFSDGLPGLRTLKDGSTIDLNVVVNLANCHDTSGCSSAQLDAVTAARPWGVNNPRWRVYASAPLTALLSSGRIAAGCYGVVLVGDDQAENDGNPLVDGVDEANPGRGTLALRAEAFCGRSTRQGLEATVVREASRVAVRSWRESDRLDRP